MEDALIGGFELISLINEELLYSNIVNIDSLILTNFEIANKDLLLDSKEKRVEKAINETLLILSKKSNWFKKIFDDTKYSDLLVFLYYYIKKVTNHFYDLMTFESNKFDNYVTLINGDKKISQEDEINLDMTMERIQHTMRLLNEAVRLYYETYHKKTLLAFFSDDEVIEYRLKEGQLHHLLALNIYGIIKNPKLVELFGITQEEIDAINDTTFTIDPERNAMVSVLHKVIETDNGNLFSYEEDRLKKIRENHTYKAIEVSRLKSRLKMYGKMNVRSKAFIDFKPLERLSLALTYPKGYKIIKSSKQENQKHSLLVSPNSLSTTFKYSSFLTNYDSYNDYHHYSSLLLKRPNEMEDLQKDGIPAITTKVIIDSDDGSGRAQRIFSKEEQLKFLYQVVQDFKNIDFSNLISYYAKLNNETNEETNTMRKKL